MSATTRSYVAVVRDVSTLAPDEIMSMAALYLENYDGSSFELFRGDLSAKNEAILLHLDGELVGFTTLKIHSDTWGGKPIRVVYSGDTIVGTAHWGQQQLAFAWIAHAGEIKAAAPSEPLYWLLLVKGHRTFKYLPAFGLSFFPHWSIDRSDLKPLADHLAARLFGADYRPETGVVAFAESRGHLRPDLALPTAEEMRRPDTRFFLDHNPGYRQGHELVCLCELELCNMKPLTARVFRRGLGPSTDTP